MQRLTAILLATLAAACLVAAPPASAQTTLTMSSWVGPTHHLTAVVLQGWANEVEKATNGRVKLTMLPKHPSAPPGTEVRFLRPRPRGPGLRRPDVSLRPSRSPLLHYRPRSDRRLRDRRKRHA